MSDRDYQNLQEQKNLFYGGKGKKLDEEKQSNYFLSVNSNQVYSDAFYDKFVDVLLDFFDNFYDFIDYYKGYPEDPDMTIKILPVPEVGGKKHRLHMHSTIEIEHRSKIKLNYQKMREYFAEHLTDGKKINLNCHVYHKDNQLSEEQLIRKYVLKSQKGNITYEIN